MLQVLTTLIGTVCEIASSAQLVAGSTGITASVEFVPPKYVVDTGNIVCFLVPNPYYGTATGSVRTSVFVLVLLEFYRVCNVIIFCTLGLYQILPIYTWVVYSIDKCQKAYKPKNWL